MTEKHDLSHVVEQADESDRVRTGLLAGFLISGALVGIVWLLHTVFAH